MPIKLKTARRKLKRFRARMNPWASLNRTTYRYIQTAPRQLIAQTGTTDALGTMSFKLNDLSQSNTLIALYDQYRIVKIESTFRPKYTANSMAQTLVASVAIPEIYTVVDLDDANNPAALSDLQEYQNCRVHQYENFHIVFTPHLAMAAYAAGAFTSYANRAKQWIDCASNTVVHYGIKYGINAGSVGQTQLQIWDVTHRYFLEFRNVR